MAKKISPLAAPCLLLAALLWPAAPLAAAPKTGDFTLDLGGRRFDPRAADPATLFPAEWRTDGAARGEEAADLRLVQLNGPVQSDTLETLRKAGLEPVQYLHPFTYIVWGTAADFGRLPTGAARWSGSFEPAYKVQQRWRALGEARIEVDVLVYRGAAVDQVVQLIHGLGAEVKGRADLDHRLHHLVLDVAGDRLREIACIPGVYTVQAQPQDGGLRGEMAGQFMAGQISAGLAVPGYLAWLAGAGVNGSGVQIANVDSGVEQTHPDLAGRMVGCTGSTCGGASAGLHGTHTAGLMAGDGSSGTLDARGFLRGLGIAPGAKMTEQVYNPTATLPGGMRTLMEQSHENGAQVSGNSWGPAGTPQGYDNDTLQVDLSVRDADDDQPGNQPLTYVLSIMNGNGGTSSQGSPDEAKNAFTVGSTRMQHPTTGAQVNQTGHVSANSGHGPALDGRKIPHMVAPGCSVDSTITGNGYQLNCGTSMSAPQVAGAVALFFQRYRTLFAADPSPALVKAAFLPIAVDLAGGLDADGVALGHRFDSKQGWGRADLAALVAPPNPVLYYDNPRLFQASGESWQVELVRAVAGQPIKMMLVWTDAPGHGLGGSTPAWNNDLDLEVEHDGNLYLGNVIGKGGWSATGGTADDRNNTEGVLIPAGGGEAIEVTVRAADLNSDGIPGTGSGTDQDFAFVCYNCALATPPLFADGFESGNVGVWSLAVP
jgi:serine protease AprX